VFLFLVVVVVVGDCAFDKSAATN